MWIRNLRHARGPEWQLDWNKTPNISAGQVTEEHFLENEFQTIRTTSINWQCWSENGIIKILMWSRYLSSLARRAAKDNKVDTVSYLTSPAKKVDNPHGFKRTFYILHPQDVKRERLIQMKHCKELSCR